MKIENALFDLILNADKKVDIKGLICPYSGNKIQ